MQTFMQKTAHMPLQPTLWFGGLTVAFPRHPRIAYFQIIVIRRVSALVGGVSGGLAVYLVRLRVLTLRVQANRQI